MLIQGHVLVVMLRVQHLVFQDGTQAILRAPASRAPVAMLSGMIHVVAHILHALADDHNAKDFLHASFELIVRLLHALLQACPELLACNGLDITAADVQPLEPVGLWLLTTIVNANCICSEIKCHLPSFIICADG